MNFKSAATFAAAVAALFFYARQSKAAGVYVNDYGQEVADLDSSEITPAVFDYTSYDEFVEYPPEFVPTQENSYMNPLNRAAFLFMLRTCEHIYDDVTSGRDYRTFYGGSEFFNTDNHPVLTGEKKGVKLPDSFCKAAGFGPGCVSTAAGAYQINVSTWREVQTPEMGGALPDFSPASQDEAALRLLAKIRALPLIDAGDIQGAIAKSKGRWASLPGSTARQGGRTLAYALARFNEAQGLA